MNFLPFLVILLTISLQASTQTIGGYPWNHLSSSDGLTVNATLSITEDCNNKMWFGTEDGLNIYDGEEIITIGSDRGYGKLIPGNQFHKLHADKRGNVFISTDKSSGVVYKESLNNFYKGHIANESFERFPFIISTVYEDEDIFLVADYDGYLYEVIYSATGKEIRFEIIKCVDEEIRSIAKNHNSLLLGTSKRLITFYLNTKGEYDHVSSINYSFVNSIVSIGDTAFIGTQNGVYLSHTIRSNKVDSIIKNIEVKQIIKFSKSKLLIATYGNGIYEYDYHRDSLVCHISMDKYDRKSISSNDVRCIFSSKDKILWVGVNGGAINYMPITDVYFKYFSSYKLSNPKVHAFLSTDYGLLVGTRKGITCIADDHVYIRLENDFVRTIDLLSKNRIAVGTRLRGVVILKYDLNKKEFVETGEEIKFNNYSSIWASCKINDSIILYAPYAKGLYSLNTNNFSIRPLSENLQLGTKNSVSCIAQMTSNELLLGTWDGRIFKYEIKTNLFQDVSDYYFRDVIHPDHIWSIVKSENLLIVGSWGSGLYIHDLHKRITQRFSTYNSCLQNNVVYGVIPYSKDHFIATTNRGAVAFQYENDKLSYCENYLPIDGLQNEEFNANGYYEYNGDVYIGGIDGFNIINKERLIRGIDSLSIVVLKKISKFDLEGRSWEELQGIDLGKKTIQIYKGTEYLLEFDLIEYGHDKMIKPQIQIMHGADTIINGKDGKIYLSNLELGSYDIKSIYPGKSVVQKINKIVVSPTSIFDYNIVKYMLIIILLLIVVFLTFTVTKKIATIREAKRIKEFARGSSVERAVMTGRLHDIVIQKLNHAGFLLSKNFKFVDSFEDLKNIKILLNDTVKDVRNALGDMHLSDKVDEVGFRGSIDEIILGKKIEASHIVYEVDIIINDRDINSVIQRELILIIHQAITNAVRHSSCTKIIVRLEKTINGYIMLSVIDNGTGSIKEIDIDKLKGAKNFGLWSMTQRAQSINADISFKSGNGFSVMIKIPNND